MRFFVAQSPATIAAVWAAVAALGLSGCGLVEFSTGTGPTGAVAASEESSAVLEMDDAELAAQLGPAVHLVESEGCGAALTGTAWAIDEHHLVTNHHVVANDARPAVIDRTGARVNGRVIGWLEQPDIAVIRVEEPIATTLSWAPTDELAEGERIVALGYPAPANDFSVTGGSIISFERAGTLRPLIRSDSAIDRGNSGGPALTTTGQVAGVATAVDTNPNGLRMVSLIYTADALRQHVDDFIADPSTVSVDCDGVTGRPAGPSRAPGGDVAWTYGDDPLLDELWDACADGDDGACDDLYWSSPYLSDYEDFAVSCGGRGFSFGSCSIAASPAPGEVPENEPETDGWTDVQEPPADDSFETEEPPLEGPDFSALDALWDQCAAGDMAACDALYLSSPYGSEYEYFGSTCGDRAAETSGACVSMDQSPEPTPEPVEPYTYGDDAGLDALWDACAGGDGAACSDLYFLSPAWSEYEGFGLSCGGRGEGTCW